MCDYKKFNNLKNFTYSRQTRKRQFSGFFCALIIFSLLSNMFFSGADLSADLSAKALASAEAPQSGTKAEGLRAELNAQLEALTAEIDKYRANIKQIQGQSKSLEREIGLLDNQIKEFELEIRRIKLLIGGLESDISGVEIDIRKLEQQTEDEKVILGALVREIYKYDETSFLEIMLVKEKLSDFFSELQSLENLQIGIQKSLEKIKNAEEQLVVEKGELEEQKNELMTLRAVQETQKYSIEKKKKERQELLKTTKGQEYLYQRLVKNKQADINTLRSQLYILQGMGGSMKFESALNLAEFASSVTGVRPAFLLALLSKESGWGVNVGTGTWRVDMNPNQHSAYRAICDKLQLNPDLMPVSRRAWYGWGGAMGPAQFLPRTWLAYENRIASITGHNPPSPWDIEDAFVAAALYLANAGAAAKTYDAEWKAAMIYLAGSRWKKPYLRFYGDQIMNLSVTIQEQINLIR